MLRGGCRFDLANAGADGRQCGESPGRCCPLFSDLCVRCERELKAAGSQRPEWTLWLCRQTLSHLRPPPSGRFARAL